MLLTTDLLSKIARYKPRLKAGSEGMLVAAIALMLRDGEFGTEVLMMQRATDPRDPWSGQMGFPGGKLDSTDASIKAASIRETHEEVGIKLQAEEYVGRLDDLYGLPRHVPGQPQTYSVMLSSFVFKLDRPVQPIPNYEVADLVWVPLSLCSDLSRVYSVSHPHQPNQLLPGMLLDEGKGQIVWGLSLRVWLSLFDVLQLPMPILHDADSMRALNDGK